MLRSPAGCKRGLDMPNFERRFISPKGLELREGKDDLEVMVGYAATFNSRSEDLGGFVEEIEPGFFRTAIKPGNLDCYSLFNHNPDNVLGYSRAGEVRVSEDTEGLYQETDLIGDTTDSTNMIAHLRAGRIHKMSFAFTVHKSGQKWSTEGNRNVRRLLADGCSRLYDVSPVTYPAYQSTSLGLRDLGLDESDLSDSLTALVRCEQNLPATKGDMTALRNLIERVGKVVSGRPDTEPLTATVEQMRARLSLLS